MSIDVTLGEKSQYPDQYYASLLAPIPRSDSREKLIGTHNGLPFTGVDVWTAYELSWLNEKGLPQVAIAEFYFPVESGFIVESKSFKYYLNSFNQSSFASWPNVIEILVRDLGRAVGAEVKVKLFTLDEGFNIDAQQGQCVDQLDVSIDTYQPACEYLHVQKAEVENEQIYSHLLKSNCPVTGQPDWATVWLEYSGSKISDEGFLKYIVSFRQHQDFHENCVEKIFFDIMHACKPKKLSVYARYTRRGGLDINPFRTNCARDLPFKRLSRQ
ncbi:MAG: NADPH-dependent 7-cyano-7-deazaguanine reductase QueF [Agarilytica sp.]